MASSGLLEPPRLCSLQMGSLRSTIRETLSRALLLTLLILPFAAKGGTAVVVQDLLPEGVDRKAAARALQKEAGVGVVLRPLDVKWLEAIRWAAEDAETAHCADALSQEKAADADITADGLFSLLLKRASSQADELELEAALETLRQARAVLPCRTSLVAREDVRTLFRLEGQLHHALKDGLYQESFLDLLAVDAQLTQVDQLPRKVREAIMEAALALPKKRPELSISTDGVLGAVSIDGLELARALPLRAGRHVVQVTGPMGEVRTTLMALSPQDVSLAERLPFVYPSIDTVRTALERYLSMGKLDAAQVRGLERYLQRTGQKIVLVALETDAGLTAKALGSGGTVSGLERETIERWIDEDAVAVQEVEEHTGEPVQTRVRLRLGAARVLGTGIPTLGSGPGIEVERRLGAFQVGAGGSLSENFIEGVPYPSLEGGIFVTYALPVGAKAVLLPGLGYELGRLPPLLADCDATSSPVACVSGTTGSDTTQALVAAKGHGPAARLGVRLSPRPDGGGMNFETGLQGRILVGSFFPEQSVHVEGEDLALDLSEGQWRSLRLEFVIGVGWGF